MRAVTAMEPEEKAEEIATELQSRRAVPRFEVDADAHLLLVDHGSTHPCRIVDLSLTGCRVCTAERFSARTGVRVEINFSVRGLAFRFGGVTQWTDGLHQVGIRFAGVPERRKNELIEALAEVEQENVAKAARRAAEKLAREEQAAALEAAEAAILEAAALAAQYEEAGSGQFPILDPAPTMAQPTGPPPKPARLKRRLRSRDDVDTSVSIHLIQAGSWLQGRILDLSPNGCRIDADEQFQVGIYTRVETEFRLDGLPFRLDGVIQGIRDGDWRNVGIRFLEMSSRKREQVEQLIEDIRELAEQETEEKGNREEGIETR
jgi:c-di-GMP-binding flagellar brake protein YcgR